MSLSQGLKFIITCIVSNIPTIKVIIKKICSLFLDCFQKMLQFTSIDKDFRDLEVFKVLLVFFSCKSLLSPALSVIARQ